MYKITLQPNNSQNSFMNSSVTGSVWPDKQDQTEKLLSTMPRKQI